MKEDLETKAAYIIKLESYLCKNLTGKTRIDLVEEFTMQKKAMAVTFLLRLWYFCSHWSLDRRKSEKWSPIWSRVIKLTDRLQKGLRHWRGLCKFTSTSMVMKCRNRITCSKISQDFWSNYLPNRKPMRSCDERSRD